MTFKRSIMDIQVLNSVCFIYGQRTNGKISFQKQILTQKKRKRKQVGRARAAWNSTVQYYKVASAVPTNQLSFRIMTAMTGTVVAVTAAVPSGRQKRSCQRCTDNGRASCPWHYGRSSLGHGRRWKQTMKQRQYRWTAEKNVVSI